MSLILPSNFLDNAIYFLDNVGSRKSIELKATSIGGQSQSKSITLVVCGKENISKTEINQPVVTNKYSILEMSREDYFALASNSESDESCIQNPTISLLEENC